VASTTPGVRDRHRVTSAAVAVVGTRTALVCSSPGRWKFYAENRRHVVHCAASLIFIQESSVFVHLNLCLWDKFHVLVRQGFLSIPRNDRKF
jgi:hypothetical protein